MGAPWDRGRGRGSAIAQAPHAEVASGLHRGDQRDQYGDHDHHHLGVEALVAIADRQVAQAACAHRAGHGGGADQRHQRDREAAHDAGQRLRQIDVPHDVPLAAAHGLCGLDQAAVHLAQADFRDTREERRGTDRQRHDRRPDTDGGAGHDACEGDERHQQHDERRGPEAVDHAAGHAVQPGRCEKAAGSRHDEQQGQRDAGKECGRAGDPDHQQGVGQCLAIAFGGNGQRKAHGWADGGVDGNVAEGCDGPEGR